MDGRQRVRRAAGLLCSVGVVEPFENSCKSSIDRVKRRWYICTLQYLPIVSSSLILKALERVGLTRAPRSLHHTTQIRAAASAHLPATWLDVLPVRKIPDNAYDGIF